MEKGGKSMTLRKRKREKKANIPKHLLQTFNAKKEFKAFQNRNYDEI